MAAVIGDLISDPSAHFHNMLANTALSRQHSHAAHPHDQSYRSSSRPRESNTTPRSGASRFPTPPSSSSPSLVAAAAARPQHAKTDSLMASHADGASNGPDTVVGPGPTTAAAAAPAPSSLGHQQPSPPTDINTSSNSQYNILDATSPGPQSQGQTIRVRDLAHLQSLAQADMLTNNEAGLFNSGPTSQNKYEISGMPIGDIIEMVAALLTKITTTNDRQHDAMQRNVAHQQQANQTADAGQTSSMSPLATSVLAFHGKNIPAITILSYLSRIHKYCPTTYEVFLSLLVYFDRMTERVNDMVVKSEDARMRNLAEPPVPGSGSVVPGPSAGDEAMADDESDEIETDSDLADDDDDDDDDDEMEEPSSKKSSRRPSVSDAAARPPTNTEAPTISAATYFVVDSFNIHRLIIAGVTCASKFFSDVFYTNSRYAKVGGLPLAELNHLELQFLLLNDFRLAVPVEDLEAYATMLVEFYAREVIVPQSTAAEAS